MYGVYNDNGRTVLCRSTLQAEIVMNQIAGPRCSRCVLFCQDQICTESGFLDSYSAPAFTVLTLASGVTPVSRKLIDTCPPDTLLFYFSKNVTRVDLVCRPLRLLLQLITKN